MALDWLIRVFTPAFLDLHPDTAQHAVALREAGEIGGAAALAAAKPVLERAGAGAAAAWDAAGDAAGDAARAAARAAAWDAAWAAAGAAARDAASVLLAPTVAKVQERAQDLLRRMAAL